MSSVQDQVNVQATFENQTPDRLDLMKIETYSGFFQDGGPSGTIEQGGLTSFVHNGTPPKGSKVGVAYRGYRGNQWVLAWHVPQPFPSELPAIAHNKVLGKHVREGETIDWEKIENELDDPSTTDKVNSPYFKAKITPMGSKAELVVEFINLPRA
ncbi:uncharacterized protein LOC130805934 [Amaranthus tricolor]|uniref:uncharacterized protein LOC130805934 n=1 Tax=Amaranthus tricolor TaxID=29722 RepID=UPI00258B3B56|nr:uncharacterized protein LOC130805934 [Amaranthus tricolor]